MRRRVSTFGLASLLAVLAWTTSTAAAERLVFETDDTAGLASSSLASARAGQAGEPDPAFFASLQGVQPEEAGSAGWQPGDPPPALYLAALQASSDTGEPSAQTASQDRHWSGLPFLGDLARQRGYQLPLPFGVTAAYNYIARDVEVTDVRVGVNGASLHSVSDVASFKARSTVDAGVLKADVWLLPFLNVYALLGYIKNSTKVNVDVTVPRPGPLPGTRTFRINTTAELEGFVGGGGLTLAGGYRQFFAMADVNYTQTELGFDDRFRAVIASARVGWNGTVGPVPLRLWAGAAYWGTVNTAKSTVDIPDVGSVRFEADQGPTHPWNAVVGASSVIHRHLEVFAEYGFNGSDVTFFAGGLTFRF
jgi:hypothetical protein